MRVDVHYGEKGEVELEPEAVFSIYQIEFDIFDCIFNEQNKLNYYFEMNENNNNESQTVF